MTPVVFACLAQGAEMDPPRLVGSRNISGACVAGFEQVVFPYAVDLVLIAQFRFADQNAHAIAVDCVPLAGAASVGGSFPNVNVEPFSMHTFSDGTLQPETFALPLSFLFLGPGRYDVIITLDGERAAELPLELYGRTEIPDDIEIRRLIDESAG